MNIHKNARLTRNIEKKWPLPSSADGSGAGAAHHHASPPAPDWQAHRSGNGPFTSYRQSHSQARGSIVNEGHCPGRTSRSL